MMWRAGREGAQLLAAILICMAGVLASAAEPVRKVVAVDPADPPALELKDLNGSVHRLIDYRGKVVLVNFWATWCEPCRDEMPSMQALYRKHGPAAGGDFVILAVNHAENAPRIEQFLRAQPMEFPVLLNPFSQVWRGWKPGLLPASFLLGRDGRLRYRARGEIDWAGREAETIVRRLLDERR